MFKFLIITVIAFGTLYSEEPFIDPSDPLLQSSVSEVAPCEIDTPEIQEIIDTMYSIARGERQEGENGVMVGLAAPQIGIAKRIILVDTGFNSEKRLLGSLQAYINPRIIWSSEQMQREMEGCYSVDDRLIGHVLRPNQIKIVALDRHGNIVEEDYSGLVASIFQHEIDHLEGIRFPDRIEDQTHLHWVRDIDLPEYRLRWKEWKVTCPLEAWKAMKNGYPYTEPN